ncbi:MULTISPECIES: hypothetical protein [Nostoc]|uniref:Uncharacterized protein n=1 Tax=Nostoc paludosum FACHB-159 TaxID=2692908 RepID=A0ABR8KKJ2_9NOSO|nr:MULTISPECIES: hypothetical protein [Nostoc]MBD2682872.1 hypothetical protein [Nostoc sp. FACHB-857]MBD2739209.1 hypothetical protein [Nostoc paludosum FACHB-159]
MYCPMGLDCRGMAGVDYKCPNISACHQNSRKPSMVKIVFYVLNQQMCQLEDIKVGEKPLTELLQETNNDLEFVLANLDNLVITQHTRD